MIVGTAPSTYPRANDRRAGKLLAMIDTPHLNRSAPIRTPHSVAPLEAGPALPTTTLPAAARTTMDYAPPGIGT